MPRPGFGNMKKTLLIIIVAVVVLGGGGFALWFFVFNKKKPDAPAGTDTSPSPSSSDPSGLTTNLTNTAPASTPAASPGTTAPRLSNFEKLQKFVNEGGDEAQDVVNWLKNDANGKKVPYDQAFINGMLRYAANSYAMKPAGYDSSNDYLYSWIGLANNWYAQKYS